MKRYAFPLTIILLLFAVIALAAPGDKRPAVTSAAIGLGTSSSPTLASITATTSVTAPTFSSSAADGYHYVLPYNSIAFAGTPSVGMFVTTPTGPQWYTGSAWEVIGSGGDSLPTQTGNSGKYLTTNGTTASWGTVSGGTWGSIAGTLSAQTDLQAALDAITAGGISISTAIPSTPGAAYLNDSTHVLTVASSTGYTQFTGSFTAWDAPTFSSATLADDGTTLTLGMSASTSVGAGGSGGIVATGSTSGALTGTYSSGAPGTSLVYTLPSSIKSGETVTLVYTQPGNGLEGTTGGADVATVSGTSVTNNSTQTASEPFNLGLSSIGTTDQTFAANRLYATAVTATSSGTLYAGHVYEAYSQSYTTKICIYNDLGTELTPDSADTLIQCTDTITAGSAAGWYQASLGSGSIVSGNKYWVVAITGANAWVTKYNTGGTLKYWDDAGAFTSPPANLSGGSVASNNSRTPSVYAEVH